MSVPSASGTRPGGDRHRRAGARSAGNELGVERVARNAIRRAHADQAGGELVEIGLADNDRAGRAQPRHRGRIVRRLIGKSGTGRRRRQAGDVDIVLHRDGNAVERPPVGAGRGQCARFRQGLGFRAQSDEDGGIAMRADTRIAAGNRLFRRCRPRPVRGHNRGNGVSQSEPPKQSQRRRPGKGALLLVRKFSNPRNRNCRVKPTVATRPACWGMMRRP